MKKENKVNYRLDTYEGENHHLYIDLRDLSSLMLGISHDETLKLDMRTMSFVGSIISSVISTAELSEDLNDIIKISNSNLYKLMKTIDYALKKNKKKSAIIEQSLIPEEKDPDTTLLTGIDELLKQKSNDLFSRIYELYTKLLTNQEQPLTEVPTDDIEISEEDSNDNSEEVK